MKKAVLWMIAGMMIMGSLKVFASSDVTTGKLDAVAQDSLEADIQAENTEGKIQAAMAEMLIEKTNKQIAEIYALQDPLAGYENSGGLMSGLAQTVSALQMQLVDADRDVQQLEQVEKQSAKELESMNQAVARFLKKN